MKRRLLWLLVIVVGALAVWLPLAHRANADARAASVSDSRVQVMNDGFVLRYSAASSRGTVPVGLVIFPETLVDPAAYAPFARAIAMAGYPVILAPRIQRGVLRGSDPAEAIHNAMGAVAEDTRAVRWILSGHGDGASLAARVALDMLTLGARTVGGILLIGSVEPHDSVLMRVSVPVAKVVGTADWRARLGTAERNRPFLPAGSMWVAIDGGNHSQFTSAGWLPGDGFASISRDEQQQQLVDATLQMLRAATEAQRNAGPLAR